MHRNHARSRRGLGPIYRFGFRLLKTRSVAIKQNDMNASSGIGTTAKIVMLSPEHEGPVALQGWRAFGMIPAY